MLLWLYQPGKVCSEVKSDKSVLLHISFWAEEIEEGDGDLVAEGIRQHCLHHESDQQRRRGLHAHEDGRLSSELHYPDRTYSGDRTNTPQHSAPQYRNGSPGAPPTRCPARGTGQRPEAAGDLLLPAVL